jgi:hypothetical protein
MVGDREESPEVTTNALRCLLNSTVNHPPALKPFFESRGPEAVMDYVEVGHTPYR